MRCPLAATLNVIFAAGVIEYVVGHLGSEHEFNNRKHSFEDDQRYFLGKNLMFEFKSLPFEESVRRLRLLIPDVDINKDGFVDKMELQLWIEHKIARFYVDDEDVGQDFRDADRNFDEEVTWNEYASDHYRLSASDLVSLSTEKKELFGSSILRDKRRWAYADLNHDSTLNRTEFEYMRHPREHEVMKRVVALEFIDEEDRNDDGYIDVEEFIASISMPDLRYLDEKEFHEKRDLNHDGKLDVAEVEAWKTPTDFNEASREAKHLIELADSNKDGKLSESEIVSHHHIFVSGRGMQYGQVLHDEF